MSRKRRSGRKGIGATGGTTRPELRHDTWTRRLSKKTIAISAAVGVAILGVATPIAFPWASDHIKDTLGQPKIDIDLEFLNGPADEWSHQDVLDIQPSLDVGKEIRLRGGVKTGSSTQKLLIESRRSAEIAVTSIEVAEQVRRPPITGTHYVYFGQGGVSDTVLWLRLDAPQPTPLTPKNGEMDDMEAFFGSNHINLTQGEKHGVQFITTTDSCDCSWRLKVRYKYRGDYYDETVPDLSKPPFRMTARSPEYQVEYYLDKEKIDENVIIRVDCVKEPNRCGSEHWG